MNVLVKAATVSSPIFRMLITLVFAAGSMVTMDLLEDNFTTCLRIMPSHCLAVKLEYVLPRNPSLNA